MYAAFTMPDENGNTILGLAVQEGLAEIRLYFGTIEDGTADRNIINLNASFNDAIREARKARKEARNAVSGNREGLGQQGEG